MPVDQVIHSFGIASVLVWVWNMLDGKKGFWPEVLRREAFAPRWVATIKCVATALRVFCAYGLGMLYGHAAIWVTGGASCQ